METCGANSETRHANPSSVSAGVANTMTSTRNNNLSGNTTNGWLGMQLPGSGNNFRSPLSFLLDYTGILGPISLRTHDSDPLNVENGVSRAEFLTQLHGRSDHSGSAIDCSGIEGSNSPEEVSIIIGNGEQVNDISLVEVSVPSQNEVEGFSFEGRDVLMGSRGGISTLLSEDDRSRGIVGERISPMPPLSNFSAGGGIADGDGGNGVDSITGDSSSHHRYDIQQIARWIEQILPFSLLLLVVFIRQHLQGFFVTIWVSGVMFKSNDILRKQTALKGDRRVSVLVGISFAFMLHVIFIYWWYRNDDLLHSLIMLPPKDMPPFWHAIFIILVNDTLVRQAAMAFKCLLLIYYKNGRGHNYRRQGQILTLVEYALLLYRALLPAAVWYRFFLNKDYGSLFSSLTTGLYLTFKLTSVVGKVQCFHSAWKALSRKEVHYGVCATQEQVNAAGDLCAICQESMHSPVILRCQHIFCEECVSEWFERERTCPLCRALVKPAEMRTFGDGSTSLMFQLF